MTNRSTLNNAILMLLAVALFALNPPLSNALLSDISPITLVTAAYLGAALFSGLALVFNSGARRLLSTVYTVRSKRLLWLLVFAGTLMSVNHLFLYIALDNTSQHELTVIIIFETWPLFYFVQNLLIDRNSRREFEVKEGLLVAVAFVGFLTLASQNIDISDWLLAEREFLTSSGWAFLGALGMSITTHFTRSAIEQLTKDGNSQGVLLASTVVEFARRAISAAILLVSGTAFGTLEFSQPQNILIPMALGAVTMSVASILYYTSLSRSKSPTIIMLWYTMPIMSIFAFATINGRPISEYEAIAATLIVSANILLNSNFDVRSSFKWLYYFMIVSGYIIVFSEPLARTYYLEIVSGGLILYGLLAAGALSRVSSAVRSREAAALNVQAELLSGRGQLEGEKPEKRAALLRELNEAISGVSDARTHINKEDLSPRALHLIYQLKLALQKVVSPGELTILVTLCLLNTFLIIFLRLEGVVFDLFAFTSALAAVYVVLIIREQDASHAEGGWLLEGLHRRLHDLSAFQTSSEPSNRASKGVFRAPARDSFIVSMAIISSVYVGFFYAINIRGLVGPAEGKVTEQIVYQQDLDQNVVIGLPNWPSAQIRAHILARSVEALFDKQVIMFPGSTDDILDEMGSRNPKVHLHPEVWQENVPGHIRRSVNALGRMELSEPIATGQQGLCVNPPGAKVLGPSLSIDRVGEPSVAQAFDHDDDGLGEIWYGEVNWESAKLAQLRSLSYGYTESYKPLLFGEKLLLRSLKKFQQEERPFIFHCYSPHYMFEDFDIQFVIEPEGFEDNWNSVQQASRGRPADLSGPAPWPDTDIVMAYVTDPNIFGPGIRGFLERFSIPSSEINQLTKQVLDGGKSPEEIAESWVAENEARLLEWAVP
ncbi:MAG: glycine betaine ABC transporter substrate-binding protein [Pseudomonadota bacterium]